MTKDSKSTLRLLALLLLVMSCVFGLALAPSALGAGKGFGTVVDLELDGAEAADALRMVAKLGGFSMVSDGAVKGSVTADLRGLTVQEVFDTLAMYYGWAWKSVGNTILVGDPARLKAPAESTSVAVFTLGYASVVDIATKLGLAVPADRIRTDARTNTVIVSGTEKELAQVRQVLKSLDVPLKQVSISARVEEVSTDALKNLGIDWSFKSLDLGMVGGKVTASVGYETVLKALEDAGSAVALAKPSVTTLDGQEASVHLGERYPVVTETVAADGKRTETVSYEDVGVKLKILPRVNGDGTVTVDLTPEVSSITDITAAGYPQISTRTTHTVVTVEDGNTIAIGGLFQRQKLETTRKTPFLGDIPFFGKLFSSTRVETKESEVVIFVTLNIVDSKSSPPAAVGAGGSSLLSPKI